MVRTLPRKFRLILLTAAMYGFCTISIASECKVNYVGDWLEPVPLGPLIKLLDWRPYQGKGNKSREELEQEALDLFAKSGKLSADDCGAPLIAAAHGYAKILEKFIDAEVDLYAAKTLTRGMTPLLAAAAEGRLEVVKLLIERRAAQIDEATPFHLNNFGGFSGGLTALHWAAMNGRVDVVKYLLESGAKVNKKAWDSKTALDWAKRRGHESVAETLERYGAKTGG